MPKLPNPSNGGSFSILLKEDLSEDYRDTIELTEIMDSLREKIPFEAVHPFHHDPEVLSADPILYIHPVPQPTHEIIL
jgi:hypothetical protein